MLTSMKTLRIRGSAVNASHSRSSGFSIRIFGASKLFSPFPGQRHRSTSKEGVSPSQWTQHTLRPNSVSDRHPLVTSKSNEDGAKKRTAYIALGSNLGDRVDWIEKACNEMTRRGIRVKRTSSLWETEPMYVTEQGSFINGACEVETTLEPLALLDALQGIENDLGRHKIIDKGPRNIDLDILLYEDQVISHERLTVPHAAMLEREFVLRPLAELIPAQTLNSASPWKGTVDYLNALPPSNTPLSTLTPLAQHIAPIRALQSNRKTHVMAIFNITPDSFSDGGLHFKNSAVVRMQSSEYDLARRLAECVEAGATIIDIGGQSTAPGAPEVTEQEEISRVVPTIELLKTVFKGPKCPLISVDTYRARVAEAAINAGAEVINDVAAGTLDPEMLPTVGRLGKTICLMHMRGTPATMNTLTDYSPHGLIPTIAQELLERVAAAEEAGIRRWRIILDPGIGFAKTIDQNLEILRRMDELRDWPGLRGLPWLLGSSRKRFIGHITAVKKAENRTWGTAATVAAAIQGGADIVRVHDVGPMAQLAKMSDAIWRV
ncbi:Dihydropteroate synthase [Mollisia scopiformis]|uniref:Folic acid synthesis protein FOL1 n=1 Tax=Mollisia scopiformis TaxID=149040 RepID=A0A132BFF0_MOLSC|nr:Dihydropteroate synthase [Mollisia scopiformis]KUJ10437.1 Dihydropteroate synthase [Mollisia scopiformis]